MGKNLNVILYQVFYQVKKKQFSQLCHLVLHTVIGYHIIILFFISG